MRYLSVLLFAAVIGPLAACSPAGQPVAAPTGSTAPSLSATTPPPAPPLDCDDPFPRQMPVTRLIPEGEEICVIEAGDAAMLPWLCPDASTPPVVDRRAKRYMVSELLSSGEAPTVYTQTVLAFQAGEAERYVSRVRSMLSSCPAHTRDRIKFTYSQAPDGPRVGDEEVSMWVERRHPEKREGGLPQVEKFRVLVVRSGNLISVVYDHGWEGAPSLDQTLFSAAKRGAELIASP